MMQSIGISKGCKRILIESIWTLIDSIRILFGSICNHYGSISNAYGTYGAPYGMAMEFIAIHIGSEIAQGIHGRIHQDPCGIHMGPHRIHRGPYKIHRGPFRIKKDFYRIHMDPYGILKLRILLRSGPFLLRSWQISGLRHSFIVSHMHPDGCHRSKFRSMGNHPLRRRAYIPLALAAVS